MIKIYNCVSCGGTGLYCGFAERKGTAVVCLNCNGQGWKDKGTKEFTGRKKRQTVTSISKSAGAFVLTGVGAVGKPMTYEQFEKSYPVKIPTR